MPENFPDIVTCLDTQIPRGSYEEASGVSRASKVFGFTLYEEVNSFEDSRRRLAEEIQIDLDSGCAQIMFPIPTTEPVDWENNQFTTCTWFDYDNYNWTADGCSAINQTLHETWCQCLVPSFLYQNNIIHYLMMYAF